VIAPQPAPRVQPVSVSGFPVVSIVVTAAKCSYYCYAKSCSSCYCCSRSYFSRAPRSIPAFRRVSCPHAQPHENLAHTRQVRFLSSPSITGLIGTNKNPTAEKQRWTVPKISFPSTFYSQEMDMFQALLWQVQPTIFPGYPCLSQITNRQ